MINAMIIDAHDDVAVAIEFCPKGSEVTYELDGKKISLNAVDDITIYHKIAIRNIKKDAAISKYGEHIGIAAMDIKAGEHVHSHNVMDHRENLTD